MRLITSLLIACIFLSCNDHKENSDVSNIKIDLTTRRFEKELFSLDTTRLATQMDQLISKYPSFGENFLYTILKFDQKWPHDTIASYLQSFISYYRKVFDTSEKLFHDFTPYQNEIKSGLQYVKYYFPSYKIPHTLITYIGPLDGYGNILDEDAVYIGLHQHLGRNFSLYKEPWLQDTYPAYVTARFEPAYISVSTIKNIIITDLFPEKNEDKTLLVQLVEKGKRLFLLNKFLPGKEEYILIGYTKQQLEESYKHEAQIWNLFIQNELLQSIDNNVIKNYVGEGPKTPELGDASPGNIGSFTGWQIVKKYMDKFPKTTLSQLMSMDAETIFREARYKP